MEKFIDWWKASNHSLHIILGFFVMLILLVLTTGILTLPLWKGGIIATIGTFIAMACVELKDKQSGNKFDWGDIFAGMFTPIAFWIVYLIAIVVALLCGDTLI